MRARGVKRSASGLGFLAAVTAAGWLAGSALAEDEAKHITCTMKFDLDGWAFIVGRAHGEGSIECKNGQKADVAIEFTSVGISFTKQHFEDATGHFTKLSDIEDTFGNYVGSGASAAAGSSAGAAGFLKTEGGVSLALVGTGKGGGLSRSWGAATITKK